jgi:hypothetical protein
VGGHAGDVQPSGGVLKEDQWVEPVAQCGVDVEDFDVVGAALAGR